MYLVPIPAFTDNYIWLLHDGARAVVVDPGDAAPVLAALTEASLQLAAILVTHHHADHIGGVAAVRHATGAQVYGPAREAIPQPCTALAQGDVVQELGLRFEVLNVPGHTAGHIAFYCAACPLSLGKRVRVRVRERAPQTACLHHALPHHQPSPHPLPEGAVVNPAGRGSSPLVFCGDTLFSGGCGRLFEGTAAQMHASLERLSALPPATLVCCTHEYTLSNLRFALAVEPNNLELLAYHARCLSLRENNLPTLPSTIFQERLINPFLRCREAAVMAAARAHNPDADDDVAVFATLRHWKDGFK